MAPNERANVAAPLTSTTWSTPRPPVNPSEPIPHTQSFAFRLCASGGFGLVFEILDRAYLTRMRRERGFGVNPWRTHSRFLVSHNLLIDPAYADPMREWLGPLLPGSLLILDEAHHAAPASGVRYGIETRFTRAVRDLAGRFEHRLFLQGGGSMQGNNGPMNKRTVRHRCKIGTAAWHAAAEASRSTRIAVFPPRLSGLHGGEPLGRAGN